MDQINYLLFFVILATVFSPTMGSNGKQMSQLLKLKLFKCVYFAEFSVEGDTSNNTVIYFNNIDPALQSKFQPKYTYPKYQSAMKRRRMVGNGAMKSSLKEHM